jgi:predicted HNH restriction endonuclease
MYKREIELANLIKKLYDFKCQICRTQLKKRGWRSGMSRASEWPYLYAETAHIKDIATFPQYDVKENMLCLCSNCHKNLDNKVYDLHESGGTFTCRDIVTGVVKMLALKPQHGLRLFP